MEETRSRSRSRLNRDRSNRVNIVDGGVTVQQCDICGTPVETPDTYRRRAEAAERAAAAAADTEAKRILKSAAQRWRQLADICEQVLQHEKRQMSD